jgi:hypothetical protein
MALEAVKIRSRRRVMMRSHEEIYELVEASNDKAQKALDCFEALHAVCQRIEIELKRQGICLGSETEDDKGAKHGSGLVGRCMRLEATVSKRFKLYDAWSKTALGFGTCLILMAPVLWWLLQDKLALVLK